MTPSTKNVKVNIDMAELSYFDLEGHRHDLGALSTRHYIGENMTRYALVRNPGAENETLTDIGIGRQELASFLNYTDVQGPMIDLGFKMADLSLGRGGTEIYSLWEYPDGRLPVIDDPITWDTSAWGKERERYVGMPLKPGIILSGTIRNGRGYTWNQAVLRLLCTNGLSRWQGAGQLLRANGRNFEPQNLAEALFNLPTETKPVTGRLLGTKRGVEKASGLIEDFFVTEMEPSERAEMIANVPAVLSDTINTLNRAPDWLIGGVIDQLMLFNANADRNIYELDVQNAVTNSINLPRFGPRAENVEAPTHSPSRAFRMSGSITQAVSDLIGIYSLAA